MKEAMRRRYYCDFCKKAGGQKAAMAQHESFCTMNPQRFCRFCRSLNVPQHNIAALISALHESIVPITKPDGDLEVLRSAADGCPACILAVIRQCGLTSADFDFTYPDEARAAWDRQRDAEAMAEIL